MKVVIYARVSLDDKDQDPERQILKCQQYCQLHGHEVLAFISEEAHGDTDPFKRPKGQGILDHNPEGIVVFSMDRFTRQHPIKVIKMIQDFKDDGIKIISVTEPVFNMEHEFSEIMLYLIAWFNNYFLTKLKRDVKSGMERARLAGKQIGRPKADFNRLRAEFLLFHGNNGGPMPQRKVALELGASLASINRFKRDIDKKGASFIKEGPVSK